MKTKVLSIVLTLSILLTLFGTTAATASAAVESEAPEIADVQADPLPGPYDSRWVSRTGNDAGDGSFGNPWRTITHAVDMLPYADSLPGDPDNPPDTLNENDRIVVFQTGTNQWFGAMTDGNAVAEHIVIDEPVLLTADPTNPNDANYFKIDITGQTDLQVIEVIESNVTIDGLFVTGAEVGIFAHPELNGPPYIENVEVLNCVVKVDGDFSEGTGIDMAQVKYADIIDNNIYVGVEAQGDTLVINNAWGIHLWNCFQATVVDNDLDVHGFAKAVGIYMDTCGRSLVEENELNVLAAGDPTSVGIWALNSDLIKIVDNTLDRIETNAGANSLALAFGIKVFCSNRAEVEGNEVIVQNNGVDDPCGLMLAMGIWLSGSNESDVEENDVDVVGVGGFAGNAQIVELEEVLSEDDLADLDQIEELLDSTLQCPTFAAGAAAVIGIKVADSYLVEVECNDVDVRLAIDFVSGDVGNAVGIGLGLAMGIFGWDADRISVEENEVMVDRADANNLPQPRPDVMVYIKVHSVESLAQEYAAGVALAASLGIALVDCDLGMVECNSVQAYASEYADIQAVPSPGDIEPLGVGSAMDRVNSELMKAVYQSFTETIGSDEIGAEISGTVPSIESFGAAGGLVAGIGILAVCSDGVMIEENMPVIGEGELEGRTLSVEEEEQDDAVAIMGGLGLGIGIAVIDSESPKVLGNLEVKGEGEAEIEIGAEHEEAPLIQDAEAYGGGAGVGFGILIVGTMDFRADAGELTGEALEELEAAPACYWDGQALVMYNQASGVGTADKICVKAEDEVPDHLAIAIGTGLGLAGGIVAVWSPCIVIEKNWVDADGYAKVCVLSEAVDSWDPLSVGGAAGVGIGIASVCSWGSQIIDNEAMGEGEAEGFVMSIEEPAIASPAIGFGGSIGIGKGILVYGSGGSLVESNGLDDPDTENPEENISNAVVTGLGCAKTIVGAVNEVPLDTAIALALAAGIGEGIAVIDSPCTDVVECNTAAGEGRARVCSWADADFDYDYKLGVSASIDILVKLWPSNNEINEVTFEGRHGPHFGKVTYNSMVDADIECENGCKVIVVDAGLLKLGWPKLDAQFNWWNAPTGPTGYGPGTGTGEAVYWLGKAVDYTPWLYDTHVNVLYEQVGKFGFYTKLCKGLNAVSTPIALEETVVPSRTWGDVVANSGLMNKIKYLYRFDDATQTWQSVLPSEYFDPLYGYYIYLKEDCLNLILMVNSDRAHEYAIPTRVLSPGWSLIGPNPIFPEDEIPVDDALSSLRQTPSGLPGYTQAISPIVNCQKPWYYVPGMDDAEDMISGRGYWVWMENTDTLVGFGFSPLPDHLSWMYGGY